MSYKNRLDALKKAWSEDKPAEAMSGLPKGKYQMEIKRALLEESKATWNHGHLQVIFHLEVVTGEYKGRKSRVMVDLEQPADKKKNFPSGISRFKQYLEIMQLNMPKQLTEGALNETLKETIGIVLNTTAVVNDKGYTNVYLNDLVSAASDSDDDEDEDTDDEDESDESEDAKDSDEESDEDEDDEDDDEDEPEEPAKKPGKASGKPPFDPKAGKSKPAEKAKPAKAKAAEDDDDEDEWDLDDE